MNSKKVEQEVRSYFEKRMCTLKKFPDDGKKNKEKVCDFLVTNNDIEFLCEVKEIKSAKASHHYAEDAKAHGEERSTQSPFEESMKKLEEFLLGSSVAKLPYSIRIDSDNLYAPAPSTDKKPNSEFDDFAEWLEKSIQEFEDDTLDSEWLEGNYNGIRSISTEYSFNNQNKNISITITNPTLSGAIEFGAYSYGGVNLGAIRGNCRKAVQQLKSSAETVGIDCPWLIALKVELSPFGHDNDAFIKFICSFLDDNPCVSGIALLTNRSEKPYREAENIKTEFFSMRIAARILHIFKTKQIPELTLICNDKSTNPLATSGLFTYIEYCQDTE